MICREYDLRKDKRENLESERKVRKLSRRIDLILQTSSQFDKF